MDFFENQPAATPETSSLHRYNETSAKLTRFTVLLRRRWWFILVMACISLLIAALVITSKEAEYTAFGRIVAGTRINVNDTRGANVVENGVLPQDFYGTQIEILTGSTLKTRAMERVRSLHIDVTPVDVDVRVVQSRNSSILNVAGTGSEPTYTKYYVEALLDEYMAFRKEMIESSVSGAMNKVIQEVLSRDKAFKEAKSVYEEFQKNNDNVVFEGERNEAALYLSKLKSNLNDYQTEMNLMERMGLDDYLKQKDRENSSSADAGAPTPAQQQAAANNATNQTRPSDLTGGLSRAEADYLRALNEMKLLESERTILLKTFRVEHPKVIELDELIQKQAALIEIFRIASSEEWSRRMETIRVRVDGLKKEILDWEEKARVANEKIVMNKSLESEVKRTYEDYQHWKANMDRLDTSGVTTSDMVSIMDRPLIAAKDEPELILPLTVAFVGGAMLGLMILMAVDRLDDRMNSLSEFQSLFPNEPVVGQIPELKGSGDVTLIQPNDGRHLYTEAFRNLRSSLLFKNWEGGRLPKTIILTSAVPNEGKTTTVANMAITMALSGSRILLVDADLRRGGLNELFEVPATPGFSDVLTGAADWKAIVRETRVEGLHLLPRGEANTQTSELFLSNRAAEILAEFGANYDYVIFDSAPVLVADDTASFAPKVDAVFFVVRISSTMARLTAKALDQLYERQVRVAGVILNRANVSLKEYTYYNYASYYTTPSSIDLKGKPQK